MLFLECFLSSLFQEVLENKRKISIIKLSSNKDKMYMHEVFVIIVFLYNISAPFLSDVI